MFRKKNVFTAVQPAVKFSHLKIEQDYEIYQLLDLALPTILITIVSTLKMTLIQLITSTIIQHQNVIITLIQNSMIKCVSFMVYDSLTLLPEVLRQTYRKLMNIYKNYI